jgi:decaprenyl-phosphate phosphoribosyltransferase
VATAAGRQLVGVVTIYVLIQVAYCLGMKREPVPEMASVASGFLLRAWQAASQQAFRCPSGPS